jgi:hypothetical protein
MLHRISKRPDPQYVQQPVQQPAQQPVSPTEEDVQEDANFRVPLSQDTIRKLDEISGYIGQMAGANQTWSNWVEHSGEDQHAKRLEAEYRKRWDAVVPKLRQIVQEEASRHQIDTYQVIGLKNLLSQFDEFKSHHGSGGSLISRINDILETYDIPIRMRMTVLTHNDKDSNIQFCSSNSIDLSGRKVNLFEE